MPRLAFAIAWLTLGLCAVAPGQDGDLYLIDAHGQIDETVDFQMAIHLMDQAGIRRVILTPVGRRTPQEIVRFSRQYPGRVLPSVRTKILGQLRSAEVQRLIEAHPNIYFLTSRSDPLIIGQAGGNARQPWVNMFQGNRLADDWKRLMVRYPERFALAFDNVWPEYWGDLYVQRARLWRHALGELPASVAQAIAHGNAERLWKIARDPIVK